MVLIGTALFIWVFIQAAKESNAPVTIPIGLMWIVAVVADICLAVMAILAFSG